ncbi:unnamed protein product [Leuciscus chuanchicus]
MDELFGLLGIGTAPAGTMHSTPLGLEETSSKSRPTTSLQDQSAGASMDEQPGTSTIQNTNLTSRQRRPQPSQFLEAYEEHAERRTAVLESLVRPDLERWRRLKERSRRSFEKKMNAKSMLNDHASCIELSVKASLLSRQVAIVSIRPHKLRQQRVGRIPNYVHSLWNKGMRIFFKNMTNFCEAKCSGIMPTPREIHTDVTEAPLTVTKPS